MKKILFYSIIALLISCASETEDKAAQVVAKAYDTKAQFSKEFITENGDTKPIYFLELEANGLLDTLDMIYGASNMGLLIYENLSQEERHTYDRFQISTTQNGEAYSQAFGFNPSDLAIAIPQAKLFNSFSQYIVDEDYEAAQNLVTPENRGETAAEALRNYIQAAVGQHGKVTGYKRTGWGMNDDETVFHYSGYLTFNSGYTLFYYIGVSRDTDEYMIGYKID